MDLLHSSGEHDPIGGVTIAGEVAERHDEPRRHQPLRGVLGQADTVTQGPRAGVVVVEGAVHVVAVAEVAQHAQASPELREDGACWRRAFYVSRFPGVLGIGIGVIDEASLRTSSLVNGGRGTLRKDSPAREKERTAP